MPTIGPVMLKQRHMKDIMDPHGLGQQQPVSNCADAFLYGKGPYEFRQKLCRARIFQSNALGGQEDTVPLL